jgi:hypothetical protein
MDKPQGKVKRITPFVVESDTEVYVYYVMVMKDGSAWKIYSDQYDEYHICLYKPEPKVKKSDHDYKVITEDIDWTKLCQRCGAIADKVAQHDGLQLCDDCISIDMRTAEIATGF